MIDFNKQHRRIERRGNLIFRLVFGWIGFCMLLVVASIVGIVYFGATLEPSELARGAGELVSEFNKGVENGAE